MLGNLEVSDFKWYRTNRNGWQPASLCYRAYYTDSEKKELVRETPGMLFLRVPQNSTLTAEISRLLKGK